MAVHYSGNLLVKIRQRPFAGLLAGPQPLAIPGYRLQPLFQAHHASPMFSAAQPADHWLKARSATGQDIHPWDEAHAWRVLPSIRFMSSLICCRKHPRRRQLPRRRRNRDLTRIGRPRHW